MNFAYLITVVVVLVILAAVLLLKTLQLKGRLTEKTEEKNALFDENQKLAAQSKVLVAENAKWRERVTQAENSRDKAQQQSVNDQRRASEMRQELDASKAVVRAAESVLATEERIKELELAIVQHRDAKGHDRCWENDLKLYRLVGGTIDENVMPPLPEFMHNCAAYYQGQCRKVETPTAAEIEDAAVS